MTAESRSGNNLVVTGLDTHELVKQLTAAGFTDPQAEALTAALRKAQDIDLSNLATKADLAALAVATKADLAAGLAETKAEIFKWMLGQTIVIIGAVVTLVKMIGH
jgi:hypothetical protein